MSKTQIVACPLRALAEFQQCQRIQEIVWGAAGASAELLQVTAKNGGAVVGAFAGKRLAGFLYAFLGRRRGRLIHWSHLMAVEPDFRDQGLGFLMKMEHRRLALEQGVRGVAWTYDPLQSRNAALNIHRLGAEVREYLPDCYGSFQSKIECGLPSDRFVAEWRIGSPRVESRLADLGGAAMIPDVPFANQAQPDARGFIVNRRLRLTLADARVLVEIPPDPDRMRALDLDLARRWRRETRRVFQHYLDKGYCVTDFFSRVDAGQRRAFYLLKRGRDGQA